MAKESHYLFGIIPLGLKNKQYLLECLIVEKALDDNLNGKLLHYLSNTQNHNERMGTNNLMSLYAY